ncbi:MAG TPA: putative zinc-binding metallopeptidase [Thermoanaerobaculia bacterium]|nr:putative zinc-binding metallopeptidase [Thermoanaerobaculia bacterium]
MSGWHEERELLLHKRISDLGLRIEGSELEPMIQQLYGELDEAGLQFKPPIYLTDEWGCPEGVPVIGVPFYLASSKLAQIEREIAENLETAEESMMYLRHEAGHAFNYAYVLYETEEWHRVFGPYSRPYIENYQPNPFSRDYVRHIAGWYAQKHPDEDFAETFAVWLTPRSDWRTRYAGTGALRKLEYVDHVLRALGGEAPKVKPSRRDMPVEEMTYTVGDYYDRRREPRVEIPPTWFDGDLRQLFDDDGPPAAPLLRRHRLHFIDEASYWTGVQPGVVRSLVDHLLRRVEELDLRVGGDELQYIVSFTAMVTTLTNNYLHHATFVPEKR